MSGHTPGPWTIDPVAPEYIDGPGRSGTIVMMMQDDDRARADARLIATAPDLLAACKAVSEHLLCKGRTLPLEVLHAVQSAIRMAEGGIQ